MRPEDWYLMLEEVNPMAVGARVQVFTVLAPGSETYEVHQARLGHFHSPSVEFHGSKENCQQYVEWQYSRRSHGLLAKLARVKIQARRPQPIRFPLQFVAREYAAA